MTPSPIFRCFGELMHANGFGVTPPRVSVVVPTLNEALNIPYVFDRLPPDVHEVIVVDGNSLDDTLEVACRLRPDVRTLRQTRTGKGNALACGFAAATGDVIAMVDADGSADPAEIPRFVDALIAGADFAKGTRFAPGGGTSDITRLRASGNSMLCAFVNRCYGTRYTDLCYGYNVFWRRLVPLLGLDATSPPSAANGGKLWGDGFEIETLINIRVAMADLVVVEVPSFEHRRIHGVSNLNAPRDGLRVLRTILRERKLRRLASERVALAGRAADLASVTSTEQATAGTAAFDEAPQNRSWAFPRNVETSYGDGRDTQEVRR
jgi:glycosyltransferase involved in cell wall biosynthesis